MDQMRNWGAASSQGLDRRALVCTELRIDDNQATRLKTKEGLAHEPHPLLVAPKHARCGVKLVGLSVLIRRSNG